MDKKIELPVFPARIKGRLHHALPLSIVAEDSVFDEWFYSNYIQLTCNKGPWPVDLNFHEMFIWDHKYPHFHVISLFRSNLRMFSDNLISFIAKTIADGYYFHVYVDEYYVPLEHHQTVHFTRDILIYGYDLDEQCFNVLGYNKTKQLGTAVITIQEFIEAYEAVPEDNQWAQGVNIYKRRYDREYKFDIIHVINSLDEYLESTHSADHMRGIRNPADRHYGLESIRAYGNLVSNYDAKQRLNIVPITILCEHKEMMKRRMIYILNKESITDRNGLEKLIDDYEGVIEKCKIIKMTVIKYNVALRQELLTKIAAELNSLIGLENIILSELVSLLRKEV